MADQQRHRLRAGFDRAAEDYQRTRPVCPPRLFDDLMRLARLAAGDRVAEIGCGTGQATVPLRAGGAMAVAGCKWAQPEDTGGFWTEVQADYRAVGFGGGPPPPPAQIGPWHFPPGCGGGWSRLAGPS